MLLQICLKHRGPWDLEIFWGPPCFGAVGWLCVWNLGAVFFRVFVASNMSIFFDGSPGIARILLEEFHEILQYHVFKCGLVALLIPCRFMIPVFWDLSSHKIPSHPATVLPRFLSMTSASFANKSQSISGKSQLLTPTVGRAAPPAPAKSASQVPPAKLQLVPW